MDKPVQLTRNDLLVMVGLSGSVRLSVKKRVRVGTSTSLSIRQRGGFVNRVKVDEEGVDLEWL